GIEAVDFNGDEYFSYKDHELIAPENKHIHTYDVANTKKHEDFTKEIKKFAKNQFLVLFFDNLLESDIFNILQYIGTLITCNTSSEICNIHAQNPILTTDDTKNLPRYIFHKFFSIFFRIIKNKFVLSDYDCKCTTEYIDCESYRGESKNIIPILENLLKDKFDSQQIIIDNCCHKDSELKMLYKIL
ncbi:hypothetical protein COBT_004102, partial [Conglomerata obtusa]